MKKLLLLLAALSLVAAACGTTTEPEAQVEPTATTASPTTEPMEDQMSEDDMDDEEMSDEEMAEDDMSEEEMDDMEGDMMSYTFTVTIENISGDATVPSPIAPGAYVIHDEGQPLFQEGESDLDHGLEALAEDGDPASLADFVVGMEMGMGSIFNTPTDGEEPGPAFPGSSYSFTFTAGPHDRLSLATMLVQSNDWFFATEADGLALFNDGEPLDGDITEYFALWDAGTEVNETFGEGTNQAPRQTGPNTGDDENGTVEHIMELETGDFIKVTISHDM